MKKTQLLIFNRRDTNIIHKNIHKLWKIIVVKETDINYTYLSKYITSTTFGNVTENVFERNKGDNFNELI